MILTGRPEGNELNLFTTYYNIGYILGAPVSNLILTVVRPRIWLPTCLLSWSFFVLGIYKSQHAWQIYILRFFIGMFESAALPGLHYVVSLMILCLLFASRLFVFLLAF